ncbi:MAG: DUF948 domain-containing protein [Candidatus Aminicenantes bacterium]|nr:DUF948 domain-containing protein [Candidatus Aminicenantes bacterium]
MSLTLNQFLLLVIAFVLVVAVTFFITLFIQLRKTAKEGEKTLREIRDLVKNLKETDLKVNAKIEEFGETMQAAKNSVLRFSDLTWVLSSRILKPTSKYWPFVWPALRLGWRILKKRKENKNGK